MKLTLLPRNRQKKNTIIDNNYVLQNQFDTRKRSNKYIQRILDIKNFNLKEKETQLKYEINRETS